MRRCSRATDLVLGGKIIGRWGTNHFPAERAHEVKTRVACEGKVGGIQVIHGLDFSIHMTTLDFMVTPKS